jgi:serine/threonine-protein kinase
MPLERVLTGQILHGTYVLERVVGQGAFGTVYVASHRRLGRKFAVKILSAHRVVTREDLERFSREAQAMSRIGHPHIVEIVDVNQTDDGLAYIAMEFIAGESLAHRLEREKWLQLGDAASVLEQAASALDAAHREGVVHRDLKPQNILLCGAATDPISVKVIDFGLAKFIGQPSLLTDPGDIVGTPRFMAPEQTAPGSAVGAAADIFALGAIAYEMITGEPAFPAHGMAAILRQVRYDRPASVAERRPGLPPGLDEVLGRALAKAATDRYPTAQGFAEAFVHVVWPGLEEGAPPTAAGQAPMLAGLGDTQAHTQFHVARSPGPAPAAFAADEPARSLPTKMEIPQRQRRLAPQSGEAVRSLPTKVEIPQRRSRLAPQSGEGAPTKMEVRAKRGGQGVAPSKPKRSAVRIVGLCVAVALVGSLSLLLWAPWRHDDRTSGIAIPDRRGAGTAGTLLAADAGHTAVGEVGRREGGASTDSAVVEGAAVGQHQLSVRPEPAGAAARAADKHPGATSVRVAAIPAGAKTVTLKKSGDRTVNRPLPRSGKARVDGRLVPSTEQRPEDGFGALDVAAVRKGDPARRARVYLDGHLAGLTPTHIAPVRAGQHKVEVATDDARSPATRVLIRPQETTRLVVELNP